MQKSLAAVTDEAGLEKRGKEFAIEFENPAAKKLEEVFAAEEEQDSAVKEVVAWVDAEFKGSDLFNYSTWLLGGDRKKATKKAAYLAMLLKRAMATKDERKNTYEAVKEVWKKAEAANKVLSRLIGAVAGQTEVTVDEEAKSYVERKFTEFRAAWLE